MILQNDFTCIYCSVHDVVDDNNVIMEKNTFLKIYFPNGSFHGIRYASSTTVAVCQSIIKSRLSVFFSTYLLLFVYFLLKELVRIALKGRLSPYELFYHLSFAVHITLADNETQLSHVRPSSSSDKINGHGKWLHPNMTMEKVRQLHGPIEQLKYENFIL